MSVSRIRQRVGGQPDILASPAFTRLATHFSLHPDARLHFHGLKRATGLPNRSLQVELKRLEQLGLIERQPDRRLVRFAVVDNKPRWRVLQEMVRQFVEPVEVLRVAIAQVADVTAAFVYGSFARGVDIHAESDIDLFVVSRRAAEASFRASLAAEVLAVSGFLTREVNVSRYSPSQVTERIIDRSRFMSSVLSGPKRWLVGSPARMSHVFRVLHATTTDMPAA